MNIASLVSWLPYSSFELEILLQEVFQAWFIVGWEILSYNNFESDF